MEDRVLPAGSNVFAQLYGVVPAVVGNAPAGTARLNFAVDPASFSGGSRVPLAFQVQAAPGSSLDPAAIRILDFAGNSVQPLFSFHNRPGTTYSLVAAVLPKAIGFVSPNYTLIVQGQNRTAGAFRIDVSLLGDANGDQRVGAVDQQIVNLALNSRIGSPRYRVEADFDLNGVINAADRRAVSIGMGVATRVRPLTLATAVVPTPTQLPDGTFQSNVADVRVGGTTLPGARVDIDSDNDGRFDDGSRLGNAAGAFSFPVTLRDGTNLIRVRAVDAVGQKRFSFITLVTGRDRQGPVVQAALANDTGADGPNADGVTSDPTIAGTVVDAGAIAALRAQLDGAPGGFFDIFADLRPDGGFRLDRARLETILGGPLADGLHTLRLQAEDVHGNRSSFFDVNFTLDTRPPETTITTPPPNLPTNQNVTVTGRAVLQSGTLARIVASIDGGGFFNLAFDAGNQFSFDTSFVLTGADDGIHTIRVHAVDAAGNVGADAVVSFRLDTRPPEAPTFGLSITSDSGALGDFATEAAHVTLAGAAEAGATVTLLETGASALASNTGMFFLPNVDLALGANTITLQARDAAGNVGATLSQTITRLEATGQTDPVLAWNLLALEAIRLDADSPPEATRGLAIVHSAILDAVNAIEGMPGRYVSLAALPGSSPVAAVGAAAHRVLSHLYPAQQATLDAALADSLAQVADETARTSGAALGSAIADALIALRETDGYDAFVEHVSAPAPGVWQPTAPMFAEPLLPQWGEVQPFVIPNTTQFYPDGPPDLSSQAWADAFNEVKVYNAEFHQVPAGDPAKEETKIARFWADGLGTYTPPGHWNQIAAIVAAAEGNSLADNARLFAQLNVALADAAILCWDVKYLTNFWRPITAIREAGGDGNDQTAPDADWTPLIVTPPFPEYVSGHSTFSGAAAAILTDFFGDNVAIANVPSFTPANLVRSFTSFNQAADEAALSRLYGGIHYRFSNEDGLKIGRDLAAFVIDAFSSSQDTQAPAILLEAAPAATSQNFDITGQILDNLAGLEQATVQRDGAAPIQLALAANGSFTFNTGLATDGSADGPHEFQFTAVDAAGNVSTRVLSFTLDTRAPAVSIANPQELDELTDGSRLVGVADGTGSAIVQLNYAFDGGAVMPMSFGPGGAFDVLLDLAQLAVGPHVLVVSTKDAAGNASQSTLNLNLAELTQFTVSDFTPTDGADEVGVTFRPQVFFARAVDASSLNGNNFFATDTMGIKLPATIVPAADGSFAWLFFTDPLPGASTITVHVDGSSIRAAADAALLDADFDSVPGGELTWTFTTVNRTAIPGTRIVGTLADPGPDLRNGTFDDLRPGPDGLLMTGDDIYLRPIENVRIFILGMEWQVAFTDAEGRFVLDNVPAGNVKLVVDGLTATNAPTGFYFPEMVMDITIEPGVDNTVMGTMGSPEQRLANLEVQGVYLPRLAESILHEVSDTEATTVGVDAMAAPDLTAAERQLLTLLVQPNSAVGPDGQVVEDLQIGISTVPTELIREMLPQGVREPLVTITVQAPGVATFTTPVELCFPNVYNDPPGTKLNFMSFDHTTGRLQIEGTATVSADGLCVVTDPDGGLTHPGWHFVITGTPAQFKVGVDTTDQCGKGEDAAGSNHLLTIIDTALSVLVPGYVRIEPILQANVLAFAAIGAQMNGGSAGVTVPFFAKFVAGLSNETTQSPGQPLSEQTKVDAAFKPVFKRIKDQTQKLVDAEVDSQASNGRIDGSTIESALTGKLTPPTVELNSRDLAIVIHGTQGAKVELVNFNAEGTIVSPEVGGSGTWNGTFRYTLCDDFGFDSKDFKGPARKGWDLLVAAYQDATNGNINSALQKLVQAGKQLAIAEGVGAAYILQHFGSAAAYEINIVVEEQISGEFTIPPGYEDVVIQRFSVAAIPGVSTVSTFGNDPRVYYRYLLDNGQELQGVSADPNAIKTDFVLPANTSFTATFYAPIINSWATVAGLSSASGQPTFFLSSPGSEGVEASVVKLTNFGGPDADGDGIPDVGEHAIGTDPENVDSDNDGISDDAEITQGTNPLDGRGFPTGVIASLPMAGFAEGLAVANDQIYVATGDQGLAIVDGTRFDNPTILGQLDLPGYAQEVGVDANLQIAAVAVGDSLELVDVSNPMTPRSQRSLPIFVYRVEVANALAYAAGNDGLHVIDLVTGAELQHLPLGGGFVSGFAREGQRLYAFVNDTLSAIDITREGDAQILGQSNVGVASFDVGLFVGNNVAWLAGSGIRAIDVTDPANMQPLHLPTGDEFITARRIALNGSGLGLLTPDGGNFVQLYNVADPTATPALLTQFNLSGNANDLAVSRGIGYIAAGNSLEVVNYRVFDNLRTPPAVTISAPIVDVDPGADGVQVLEGATIPVMVAATDDVQVRQVDLLVNGAAVQSDVAFPFDFFAAAPNITPESSSFTLQVRATDTGGNVTLSNLLNLGLVEDSGQPTVVSVEPADGAARVEGAQSIRVRFSESLDPRAIDAVFVRNALDEVVTPLRRQLRGDDRVVQLDFTGLTKGAYDLVIDAGLVTDRAGNPLGAAPIVSEFTVTPRASLTTSLPDADADAPGLQLFEGMTIPISVQLGSGVQGQSAQLFIDGQPMDVDSAAPFAFSFVAPLISPTTTRVTLVARLTDAAGFTTVTDDFVIELLEDVTAPSVVSTNPANGAIRGRGMSQVRATFSEPLDPSSVTVEHFQLMSAGDNGTLGDGDDVPIALQQTALSLDDTVVSVTTPPLDVGFYRLLVRPAGIRDRAGNAMPVSVATADFEVKPFVLVTFNFDGGDFNTGLTYSESGMTVTSAQDHLHMGDQNNDGSPDLLNHSDCCSTPYEFTVLGQTFSVISFTVVGGTSIGQGTFTSSSGASVTPTALGLFELPAEGWTNLTSFSWDQLVGDMIIDDLVLALLENP